MFARDPMKKAARDAQKATRKDAKAKLREWRQTHPAEQQMNLAATLQPWASSEYGETRYGPVAGGKAEFFNADAHKAWTATRLIGGALTLGASALATGRKNKGSAAINVVFGNGAVATWTVKADSGLLAAANRYVTAFNALAQQLEAEQGQ